jgi:hypothetical protein
MRQFHGGSDRNQKSLKNSLLDSLGWVQQVIYIPETNL